tara:strand:+ start:202 stop:534 length:333 start_codon:yes stop_codon:yes gene_type:complete
MSIEKNRLLMEQQIQKLKGQLNEMEDQLNENYRFKLLEPFTMDELIMTIKANVDPAYIDKKSIQQEFDELLEYHVAEAKKEFKFHLNGIIGMFKSQREKDLKLMAKNRKR